MCGASPAATPRLERGDEATRLVGDRWTLTLTPGRPWARFDVDGERWGELAIAWAADRLDALDSTGAVGAPRIEEAAEGLEVVLPLEGSAWREKHLRLRADGHGLRARLEVTGAGRLTDVTLLGGAWTGKRPGALRSRLDAGTLFSPEPDRPNMLARRASEPARIDVSAGRVPERGHWFFTPPPFVLALSRSDPAADAGIPPGPWLWLAVAETVAASTFTALEYRPAEEGCELVLAYEGQTAIAGEWASPWLLVGCDTVDPYAAVAAYRERLNVLGLVPPRTLAGDPAWWTRPIFCGWGAQCAEAVRDGGGALSALAAAPRYATQQRYDRYLATLAERGLDPGTITVDDKWQIAYGTNEVDIVKWPDLRGWIRVRHAEDRRVLLWWKAWDAEGVAPELCVRDRVGRAVAVDPTNPEYEALLRRTVRSLLSPDALDADGLKVDFTAESPVGPGLARAGGAWGVALLHRLLQIIWSEAHAAKPDALVVAHAPNPAFVDVVDMIRLNDALRLAEPTSGVGVVRQMRHRARIVRAACPELLIDTDDWAMPDRATWREYQLAKPDIGVPALYYTDAIDVTGERLTDADAALVRDVWAEAARRGRGGTGAEAARP